MAMRYFSKPIDGRDHSSFIVRQHDRAQSNCLVQNVIESSGIDQTELISRGQKHFSTLADKPFSGVKNCLVLRGPEQSLASVSGRSRETHP